MSLFNISHLLDSENDFPKTKAAACSSLLALSFAQGETLNLISETIGTLQPGKSIFYHTEGAWSNIDLLEHMLKRSGPANLYFCTWSISIEAIRRIINWKKTGLVKDLFIVADKGIRNRKPEIYQQLIGNFSNIVFTSCHAKVTVIQNQEFDFCFLGSANYTTNPRLEAGILVNDKATADNYIGLLLDKIQNGNA